MFLAYEGKLKDFSRELRTHMTDAEKVLWLKLRRKQLKGYQFYRQKIVGDYIVDFYCPMARLIVEVDGGQHYGLEEMAKDRMRDGYLRDQGLEVLRFSDREVLVEGRVSWRRFTPVCRGENPPQPSFMKGGMKKGFTKGKISQSFPLLRGGQPPRHPLLKKGGTPPSLPFL